MKLDRYEELFERSADANLIIVGEKFIDCNSATISMLGYKNKQALLDTHPSQLSPEYQPDGSLSYVKANEMMLIAFEKGSHRFEWNHLRANGEVFPVEVLLTSLLASNEKTLHVVWRDITYRKNVDTALRESRNQLDAIFNATKDGILVVDVKSKALTKSNKAFNEMLGYTAEELTKLKIEDVFSTKDSSQVISQFEKFARQEADLVTNIHVLRKNASVFFADIGISLVTIDGRQCMVGIFRDVTIRREIEEKMRHAKKLEAIGILAGGIAHDFNNILAAMLGYTELTINQLPSSSKLENNLTKVLQAGKRAADLIKKILIFSQHSTSDISPLKIQSCVKEVLELLRATMPSNIEINQEINNSCGSVMADATQIHQVLMNLCTNAFHAMEETGGTLDVRLHEINITGNERSDFHDIVPGKYLELEVIDNGPGIDEKIITHVFDPYFTTKPQGKGSGLGLAVVYGIVKDHGGMITVESKVHHGAVFRVILPVVDIPENKLEIDLESQDKSQPPGGNERILFVDDDVSIAVLGQEMLETLGYSVRYETDSKLALERFKAHPQYFDLVITDQTMPHMLGSELAKELVKINPDIPIIICTGYSSMISERKARDLGIKAFVMKPADRLTLAKTIRKVLL